MIRHVKRVHMESSRYNCDGCDKTFLHKFLFYAHDRKNHQVSVKRHFCDICTQEFLTEFEWKRHIRYDNDQYHVSSTKEGGPCDKLSAEDAVNYDAEEEQYLNKQLKCDQCLEQFKKKFKGSIMTRLLSPYWCVGEKA